MLNMRTVLEKVVPFLIEQQQQKKPSNICLFFPGQPMHDCLHTMHLYKELCNSGTVSLQEPQCSHTDMENTALWKMIM